MSSNAENVSIWWHHHDVVGLGSLCLSYTQQFCVTRTHCFIISKSPVLYKALVSKYAATFHSLDFFSISSLGTHVEGELSLKSAIVSQSINYTTCTTPHSVLHYGAMYHMNSITSGTNSLIYFKWRCSMKSQYWHILWRHCNARSYMAGVMTC